MDLRNDDEQPVDGSDEKIIVDGLFGIANEEDTDEINSVTSSHSDEIQMELEYDSKIHREKFSIEKDQSNSKLSEVDADGNNFDSRILCSNSTDPDKSDIQPSFALISENYEKSRKYGSKETVTSDNQTVVDQAAKLNAKSVVLLPERRFPSTLSLISANYQDSSSDDSDSSAISISYAVDSEDEKSVVSVLIDEEPVKTRGELDISDLPPIEDLKITVDEDECQPVGSIKSIVKTLVVVEAFLNQPALDIDSVLFVDRGQRALGRIFDVFGPVNKPYYAVRFNDSDHIKKFDIQIKEPVYCAPKTEHSSFVLVSRLLRLKGSDASWKHNNEPPFEYLDYSDDEAEKLARKKRRQKKRADSEESDNVKKEKSPSPPSQVVKRKSRSASNISNSSSRNSNRSSRSPNRSPNIRSRPSSTHSPHLTMYGPHPPKYSYGPRPFPTYAQHLSSMEYSHTYRQPYHPYYYEHMYPPRHGYPYPYPYRQPGYDYRSRQPRDPSDPNQHRQRDYDYM